MRNQKIKLSDSLEITVKTKSEILEGKPTPVYEYYLGKTFVFGVLKPFTPSEIEYLFKSGYFNYYIGKEVFL